MKIAVICGGISPERNVSITGGKAVKEALEFKNHQIVMIDPAYGIEGNSSPDFNNADMSKFPTIEELAQFNPKSYINCINSSLFDDVEVAFIVLHGKYGEDGLIQSLLQLRGIPYTGSGVKASSLAMDKASSKLMFSAAGILTPQFTILSSEEAENHETFNELRKFLGKKMVIKPNDQGSTIGLTIIDDGNLDDIENAVKLALKYSSTALVERFIEGLELTVSIVGNDVLPVIEIITEDGFYDYEHKYTKGRTEYICPAHISEDIAEFTQTMAMSAYNAIGCSGFARVDFRLDEDGQPYCLEVNTIPGFTSQSLVPMAARETGVEFPELCENIINLAIEEQNNRK
jgi:D-alanine-D-alanine ligase